MPDAVPKIYGPNPRARNIMLGLWLLFALPLTVLGVFYDEPAMLGAAALLSAIMLPIFVYVLRAAKLILTSDGIELRQVGARVFTPWHNVAAVRTQRGAEGLVLHQPISGKGAERLAAVSGFSYGGAPLYDEERRRLLYEKRFIALDGFAHWLHKGDLHQMILQHATALSADAAMTSPEAPPATVKMSGARIALIIAIIVAAAALGIASALSPKIMSVVEPVIAVVLMLALGVYAVANGHAALNHLRARRFGWFTLLTLVALVQALIVFAVLEWVFKR